MSTNDVYKRALEKIAGWDASRKSGRLDEWQEADAFHAVQRIAAEALDPELRARRIAAQEAELAATKKAIGGLRRNERYFYCNYKPTMSGAWVRFLKGDPDRAYQGIVRVKVIENVNSTSNSTLRAGKEITLHISNLMSAPGQPLPA